MRGGMRIGAGRPGWKGKVGNRCHLDVRSLAREGWLTPGRDLTWSWSNNGERIASIGMLIESDDNITLHYSTNGVNVRLPVRLTRTECNYGGDRIWFQCPCRGCSRRVAIIYLTNGTWGCRHCARLTYASQCDDAIGRTWRKQAKIERRLSDGGGNEWAKPKGMHQKTFDRLREVIFDMESRRDAALYAFAQRYLGPNGRIC